MAQMPRSTEFRNKRKRRVSDIHSEHFVYVFERESVWPRRKYEISLDGNPFPAGGRFQKHTVSWQPRGKFTGMSNFRAFASNQCPNKLPHGRRGFFSWGPPLFLSHPPLSYVPFPGWNPSSPRLHPSPFRHAFPCLPKDSDAPSTSTAIHRQRLRRLTLLELQAASDVWETFSRLRVTSLLYDQSLLSRRAFMTDANLATDSLPEMLTKRSRVSHCR